MMIVVIANDLPPAVRGRMKLWFVEPRANIFVSGIKDSVAEKVIQYLLKSCTDHSGLLIFEQITEAPGFKIFGMGDTRREITEIEGYQLIIEKMLPI